MVAARLSPNMVFRRESPISPAIALARKRSHSPLVTGGIGIPRLDHRRNGINGLRQGLSQFLRTGAAFFLNLLCAR
jgi:hypothetical protein